MVKQIYRFVIFVLVSGSLISCNDGGNGPLSITKKSVDLASDMTISQRTLEASLYFRYAGSQEATSAQITRKNEPELFTAIPGRNGYLYTISNNIYVWTGDELEAYVLRGSRWEVEYREEKPWRVSYIDNRSEDTLSTYRLRFAGENIRALEVYDSDGLIRGYKPAFKVYFK